MTKRGGLVSASGPRSPASDPRFPPAHCPETDGARTKAAALSQVSFIKRRRLGPTQLRAFLVVVVVGCRR